MAEGSTSEMYSQLKSRIESGEFDERGVFHRFVENEIYPLLVDGSLSGDDFSSLVVSWSGRNYPFSWRLKPAHIES